MVNTDKIGKISLPELTGMPSLNYTGCINNLLNKFEIIKSYYVNPDLEAHLCT